MKIIKYSGNRRDYVPKPGDVFEWEETLYKVNAHPEQSMYSACKLCIFQPSTDSCHMAPGCGSMESSRYYTVFDFVQLAIEEVKEAEDDKLDRT